MLGAAAVLDLSPCGATIGVLGEDSALTADVGASILTSSLSATGQKVATLGRRRTAFWLERLVPARILDGLGVRRRKFEKAAKSGVWSMTGESVSGAGSSLQATERLRAVLPHVLREFEVRTLLDAPCGDWNWMSHVDLPVERYIGGDIVRALVDENRLRYGSPERDFRVIDLCVDPLPHADMLLCRDALIHFSFADIWRALENIRRAEIEYIATTTFVATEVNADQATGRGWRHLNLQAPPFEFPEPMRVIDDNFNREDQRLCVWRVTDLRAIFTSAPR